jgi:hypothetical protein
MTRLDLTASQNWTLNQLRDAGAEGVAFDDLRLGDALALALEDLVRPSKAQRRVYITTKGEAFLARVTA